MLDTSKEVPSRGAERYASAASSSSSRSRVAHRGAQQPSSSSVIAQRGASSSSSSVAHRLDSRFSVPVSTFIVPALTFSVSVLASYYTLKCKKTNSNNDFQLQEPAYVSRKEKPLVISYEEAIKAR